MNPLIAVGLPAFLFLAFADHFWHSLVVWLDFRRLQASGLLGDRPEEPARSFRNFIIAQALAIATLTLLLRSLAFYLVPETGDVIRLLGFAAYGDLLVVGGFLVISWRQRR